MARGNKKIVPKKKSQNFWKCFATCSNDLEELSQKNPNTAHWKQLEKKIDPTKGGSEGYVVDKILKTERHREARSTARADRRAERKHDDSLAHKFRALGEDVELYS